MNSGGSNLFGIQPTEKWTILCQEFSGSLHRDHCDSFSQSLRRTPDVQPAAVRCDHDDINKVSRLYYGSYARRIDPKTHRREPSQALLQDLNLIKSLGDDDGLSYFSRARMVPQVNPQSGAHPEWALINAPGLYSLQIAVFYPQPGFEDPRRVAMQFVEELRKDGREAYYHHGSVKSMVTVGSFDESAVIQGEQGYRKLSPQVEALQFSDPRFKYNYENGQVLVKKIAGRQIRSPSFLINIPNRNPDEPGS